MALLDHIFFSQSIAHRRVGASAASTRSRAANAIFIVECERECECERGGSAGKRSADARTSGNGGEIITLQPGPEANWVARTFWELQNEVVRLHGRGAVARTPSSSIIDRGVHFGGDVSEDKEFPRVILFDVRSEHNLLICSDRPTVTRRSWPSFCEQHRARYGAALSTHRPDVLQFFPRKRSSRH